PRGGGRGAQAPAPARAGGGRPRRPGSPAPPPCDGRRAAGRARRVLHTRPVSVSPEVGAPTGPPAERTPILTATGLTKRFGGFVAVEDVGFALVPGVVTAMIGPNGAGKSTVINLLSGVLLPNAGEIVLHGSRIDGSRPHTIARLGLARTFQTPK